MNLPFYLEGAKITHIFTDKQVSVIERLEPGSAWYWGANPESDDILRYLHEINVARPREDIAHNHWELTQPGKSALHALRKEAEEKYLDSVKTTRIIRKEIAKSAEEKRRYRCNNYIAIFGYILSPVLGFLVGKYGSVFLDFISRLFSS